MPARRCEARQRARRYRCRCQVVLDWETALRIVLNLLIKSHKTRCKGNRVRRKVQVAARRALCESAGGADGGAPSTQTRKNSSGSRSKFCYLCDGIETTADLDLGRRRTQASVQLFSI